jgi:putative ABC transport system permease protein
MFELKGVSKSYGQGGSEKWALKDVSFVLPTTGLVAIRGHSGSGKSTLLNLLSTLEKPTSGEILFAGKRLEGLSKKEQEDYRSKECGFVYQHFNLLGEEAVLFNAELPLLLRGCSPKEAEAKVQPLLAQFELTPFLSKKAASLSGGEKQRLALVRALSTEPAVLFADEPTGALDEVNSEAVLAELKRLSAHILVLLVSHNEDIISRYASRVLTLKDGRLVADSDPAVPSPAEAFPTPLERGHKKKWLWPLFKEHYLSDSKRNLLSFFAGVFGFSSLLLSLGFLHGTEALLEKEKSRSLLYLEASLSEKISYPLPNSPLSLNKKSRPSESEALALIAASPSVSLEEDYSYFFPSYESFSLNGLSQKSVSFAPVFDLTLAEFSSPLLSRGRVPITNGLSEILVNEEFLASYGQEALGSVVSLTKEVSIEKEGVSESVKTVLSATIVGVVKEFSFLNSPRIYYSYAAMRAFYGHYALPSLSASYEREMTVATLLEEALGDEGYCSFDYWLFAHDASGAAFLRSLASSLAGNGSAYEVSSASFASEKAFASLREAVASSLVPFLIIEVVGVAFILGALSFSSFLERKKEAAILSALGARGGDIRSLYLYPAILTSCFSAIFSMALAPFLEKALNRFIEAKTALQNVIAVPFVRYQGYFLVVELGLLAFAFFLAFGGAGLPLLTLNKRPLVEALRDE